MSLISHDNLLFDVPQKEHRILWRVPQLPSCDWLAMGCAEERLFKRRKICFFESEYKRNL